MEIERAITIDVHGELGRILAVSTQGVTKAIAVFANVRESDRQIGGGNRRHGSHFGLKILHLGERD